jgi:hydrogenase expression/formation protein HypD
LCLRPEFGEFDAAARFGLAAQEDREPPGCLCGQVITGAVTPHACKLFGKACTPIRPIGPCMVSSEGTCAAYFKYARVGVGLEVFRPGIAAAAEPAAAGGGPR